MQLTVTSQYQPNHLHALLPFIAASSDSVTLDSNRGVEGKDGCHVYMHRLSKHQHKCQCRYQTSYKDQDGTRTCGAQPCRDLLRFMYIWYDLPYVALDVRMCFSKQSLSPSSQKLNFIPGPRSNTRAYIYSQLQSIVSQYDPIERWQSCAKHT